MHDILIATAFAAMVIAPCLASLHFGLSDDETRR